MHPTHWHIKVNFRLITPHWPRSAQARAVQEMFGLRAPPTTVHYQDFELTLAAGQVAVVVGPSGAGKSVLLRAVRRAVPDALWLDTRRLARCPRPVIEALDWPVRSARRRAPPAEGLKDRLALLSRCGLAEAAALLTPARRLSGGQLDRLALAAALWRARCGRRPRLILADEFAATLDTVSAEGLAGQLPRLARDYGVAFLLATPRQELLPLLRPDLVVVKPWGEDAYVTSGTRGGLGDPPSEDTGKMPVLLMRGTPMPRTGETPVVPEDFRVQPGSIADYRALAGFHYLAGPPAAHKRVWIVPAPPRHQRLLGGPKVAAVLVVSPPVLCCRGRNVATRGRYTSKRAGQRAAIARLNAELECISRVVVHPMYRSTGLAVRLVRHALAHAQTPLVEALAVMGAMHPFFERARMLPFGRFAGREKRYCYYLAYTGRKANE